MTLPGMPEVKPTAKGWSAPYIVGGWEGYTKYIAKCDVPLCDHKHDTVPVKLQKELVDRGGFPSFFQVWCLTEDWNGYPKGSEVITYGSWHVPSVKCDLWVKV